MNKKDIYDNLLKLDEEICDRYGDDFKIEIVVVGGSGFLLGSYISRSTLDIDLYGLVYIDTSILEKYNMNTNVNAFSMMEPYNYRDRLVKIDDIQTKVINYYRFSLEDLVVMKLSSTRGKDYDDITEDKIVSSLNWDLLEKIVYEECDNSFNEKPYKELIERFEKYKKEFHK